MDETRYIGQRKPHVSTLAHAH